MGRWQIVVLLLAVALLAAIAATPALAAKGGNGGGKGGGKGGGGNHTSTASLSVSPDPVSAWGAVYSVTGSGFKPGKPVSINTADPGCCLAFDVWPDDSGKISFSRTAGAPGTYKIEAYQQSGRKMVLMATVSLAVVEP